MISKMTFIDNLKNIQPITFNETITNVSNTAMSQSIIDNANQTTGDMWFIIVILVLFVWLVWYLMDKEKGIILDLPRSLFVASSWCLTISVIGALTVANTIIPIIWFSTIFFLTGIMVMKRSNKGQ